jgi:nucleoid-associated protein YgaU
MSVDKRFANMGKVKRTTEEIMNDAIAKQSRISALWNKNRPSTPAVSNPKQADVEMKASKQKTLAATVPVVEGEEKKSPIIVLGGGRGIKAYWFPIMCAVCVLALFIWAMIPSGGNEDPIIQPAEEATAPAAPVVRSRVGAAATAESTVRVVDEAIYPAFDIVRIEKNGNLIIAGRYLPAQSVSILMNNKIVATERTDNNGEFVHAPTKRLSPGNYTIRLAGVDRNTNSENDVFVYIPSDRDYTRSLSLLMTRDGSRILQAPRLADGDLAVSKIDYLENGRLVVQGTAVPRLRVSLTLNNEYLGFARTSDHRNFMLGVTPPARLEPGQRYNLAVRLHDTSGTTVATVTHRFTMPQPTGGDDTYYTVRHGDALWIISRNFLGRGSLFTILVENNNIRNPNLIFPNQRLRIPFHKAR